MIFKDGAGDLFDLSQDGRYIAEVADKVHQDMLDREVVITETNQAKHRVERSAHYRGDAIDIRIWYTEEENCTESFCSTLREELGPHYVVILEHDHVHVHWAPIYEG